MFTEFDSTELLFQQDEVNKDSQKPAEQKDQIRPWNYDTHKNSNSDDGNSAIKFINFRSRRNDSMRRRPFKQNVQESAIINQNRLNYILRADDPKQRLTPNNKNTGDIRQFLKTRHMTQEFEDFRPQQARVVYQSVKCREFKPDQTDLPKISKPIKFQPWISRRGRFMSSTSPINIPEHLKYLFTKPKTRAGGAAMNTRYSAFKQPKTEEDEDSNSKPLMRITGIRFSKPQTRSLAKTTYAKFF